MATTGDLVQLAERIVETLPEVSRNEWMRWMQVVEQHGLEHAIRYADRLSKDLTMRPSIRRDNKLIGQTIKSHLHDLKRLSGQEQGVTLGYVAWLLRIHTVRGSLKRSK
jgi:hypothetical protein